MIDSKFLQGLEEADVRTVLDAGTKRRLSSRAVIYEQGSQATEFLLLTTGHARYFSVSPEGRKMLLHWLVPGDVLGVVAILQQPSTYRVSAEAVKDSTMIIWSRPTIQALVDRYPRLLQNALTVGASYLDLYIAAYSALVSETARERLGNVLARLAPAIGREVVDGIELQVTNEELANAANITPFTASRIVSEWQANNVITKRRGRIILHLPERLFKTAS
jgi:CRP/FNR family transcriptional regulator, nitrogen oxide reductase regulator